MIMIMLATLWKLIAEYGYEIIRVHHKSVNDE